jgi:hypothetical protein
MQSVRPIATGRTDCVRIESMERRKQTLKPRTFLMDPRYSVALLLALPSLVLGQSIRGTAVERMDRPVGGVVLVLLDSAGRVAARALTNDRGQFRLSPGAAGRYRVRTYRIGYHPVLSDPVLLKADEEVEQRIRLSSIPVSLDTVRVASRGSCRALGESGEMVATVWEQARIALTATQLTAGARTMRATNVRHHRTLDPTARRMLHEYSVADSGFVIKLWRSLSADSLRRFGYVHEGPDGWKTYYAPDEAVLLSDEFVGDHCFRLANASDETLIGIAFEPSRDRSRIPDIRGTLWLDRKSSELRRMEFTYVNTGARGTEDAGGDIDYVRLRDGTWTIRRWNIRMPLLEQRGFVSQGIPGTVPVPDVRVREWHVAGGELSLLLRGADTVWSKGTERAASPTAVVADAGPAPPVSAPPAAPASTPPPPATRVSDSAVSLRPVEVAGGRRMLTEFEERRGSSGGHFLTRAELAKQEARGLPEILSQVPGLRIARGEGRAWVTSGRNAVTSFGDRRQPSARFDLDPQRACYADVWVDGVMMYGGRTGETRFDISTLPLRSIEGIEYYASGTQAPPKYNRSGAACGVILIWTRS